jgi:hypothetical protein
MKHEQPQTTAARPIADLSDLTSASADTIWRLARELRQEWRRERYSRLKAD